MMLDFPIPMLIPSFVKMDVSELPALLASLQPGAGYGVAVCLVKNVLAALFHGSTGGIGEVCNFLIGAAFTGVAGLLYRRNKTRRGAVDASLAGAVVMALVSVPVNFIISYPVYATMYGGMDASWPLTGRSTPAWAACWPACWCSTCLSRWSRGWWIRCSAS